MGMTSDEIERRFASLPVVEPDADERAAIEAAEKDEPAISLDEVKRLLDYSGKLSLRIPKSLHQTLSEQAK